MSTIQDVVRKYALLECAIENAHARGERADSAFYREKARIENLARVHFSPQQLQQVMQHVEVAKMHIKQHEIDSRNEAREAYTNRQVNRVSRELTRGINRRGEGLTRDELAKVVKGEQVSFPGRKRQTQAERDQEAREMSKRYDPQGKGWGEAELVRRLDELVEAKPDHRAALSRQYLDQNGLRVLTGRWETDRYGHEMERRQRVRAVEREKDAPATDDKPRELTTSDRRRATIANAMMNQAADVMEDDGKQGRMSDPLELNGPGISSSYLNERDPEGRPTRRAHLAHALAQQEWGEAHEYGLGTDE